MRAFLPLLALIPMPVLADDAFLEANILGIFYHELGHAVIHIEEVPIFAQEEDAADVFSIFLIDALYDEEVATGLAYDAALGFWFEAEDRGADIAWWDVHGPDEQRFYNTACIFYGADPEAREDFADELDIPEERRDYCPDEYDQANAAWGLILDEMTDRGAGTSIRFDSRDESLTADILKAEIDALNAEMTLAEPLSVVVEPCGEANAFYDPSDVTVTFCTEFEAHLRELAGNL